MKYILLLTLLFHLDLLFANPIEMNYKSHIEDRHDSVSILTLELLNNRILVSSLSNLKEVDLVIKDFEGSIIYRENFSISVDRPHYVLLPLLESGIYMIELFAEGIVWYGHFIIE